MYVRCTVVTVELRAEECIICDRRRCRRWAGAGPAQQWDMRATDSEENPFGVQVVLKVHKLGVRDSHQAQADGPADTRNLGLQLRRKKAKSTSNTTFRPASTQSKPNSPI